MKQKGPAGTTVEMFLVYQAATSGVNTTALAPGVRAVGWRDYLEAR